MKQNYTSVDPKYKLWLRHTCNKYCYAPFLPPPLTQKFGMTWLLGVASGGALTIGSIGGHLVRVLDRRVYQKPCGLELGPNGRPGPETGPPKPNQNSGFRSGPSRESAQEP